MAFVAYRGVTDGVMLGLFWLCLFICEALDRIWGIFSPIITAAAVSWPAVYWVVLETSTRPWKTQLFTLYYYYYYHSPCLFRLLSRLLGGFAVRRPTSW